MDLYTIEWIKKLEKQVDDLTKENTKLKKRVETLLEIMHNEIENDNYYNDCE